MQVTGSNEKISIQVSLGGYSFNGEWHRADSLFTTPEFQRRYGQVDVSLLTPKCTLVPQAFFSPEKARGLLEDVCRIRETDFVEYVEMPSLGAVLVYSLSIDESLSKVVSQTVLPTSGNPVKVLPEMYYLLRDASSFEEYNKIAASWADGWLHLVIFQGKSLMLANCFAAADFTTALYHLLLCMKRLQLNPEVSTVCWRTPIDTADEMTLYRYFKSVMQL